MKKSFRKNLFVTPVLAVLILPFVFQAEFVSAQGVVPIKSWDFTTYQTDTALFSAFNVSTQNNVHIEPGVGMRYDFIPKPLQCGDQALTSVISVPDLNDVWIEFNARFSDNWTNINPNCTSPSPDYKFVLAWTRVTSRFDFKMGTGINSIHATVPGWPGTRCAAMSNAQIPGATAYFDGKWHNYRLHFGHVDATTSIVEVWIDGIRTHSYIDCRNTSAGAIHRINFGANRNLGATELMNLWWKDIKIYDQNPGWSTYTPPPPPADTTTTTSPSPQTTSTHAPVVSNITVSSISSSQATITWNTDIPSDSQVRYGLNTSYGSLSSLDTNLTTSHSVKINKLSPSTTYYYRVISKSAGGLSTESGDQNFHTTTKPGKPFNLKAVIAAVFQAIMNLLDGILKIFTFANTAYAQTGGNAANGRTFIEMCKTVVCHVSGDMYDLAYFDYPDSSIYRRARPHVPSSQVALDIVAYINDLRNQHNINPVSRDARLYQPGGVVLNDDRAFGLELFGADEWPASLTPQELKAIDPEKVKVALPLPAWSNEDSNYEWLPTLLLPRGVLSNLRTNFDNYYSSRSDSNLNTLVGRIMGELHDLNSRGTPDAVCVYPPDNRWDSEKCFDAFKWASALTLDTAMRKGNLSYAVTQLGQDNQWWDIGHIAHKSRQHSRPIQDIDLHIAGWIHLGWIFDLALNKNSLYESTPLANLGLRRHSTFVALRTMVERNPNASGVEKIAICGDIEKSVDDGYTGWMHNSTKFAYQYILSLVNSGWRADSSCKGYIQRAQATASNKLSSTQASELKVLADQLIAKLP